MTVQPTDTNMELAELLVGMHNNAVQTLGQKRALVPEPCVTMERPPVLENRRGDFKWIHYPFLVNNELFMANESYEIPRLIDAKVRHELIDHFTEQNYIPVHQQAMHLKLKRYLETGNVNWTEGGQKSDIFYDKFKRRTVGFQRSEANPVLKEGIRKILADKLTQESDVNKVTNRTVNDYLRLAQTIPFSNLLLKNNYQFHLSYLLLKNNYQFFLYHLLQ